MGGQLVHKEELLEHCRVCGGSCHACSAHPEGLLIQKGSSTAPSGPGDDMARVMIWWMSTHQGQVLCSHEKEEPHQFPHPETPQCSCMKSKSSKTHETLNRGTYNFRSVITSAPPTEPQSQGRGEVDLAATSPSSRL